MLSLEVIFNSCKLPHQIDNRFKQSLYCYTFRRIDLVCATSVAQLIYSFNL